MPTSMLDGGATVALPRRPLQIRVQPASGLVLEVRSSAVGATVGRFPQPGLVVLPSVKAPAVVVARSATGRPLPAATTVSVDIVSGAAASADPERAVLSQVKLGGLIERELVEIEGADERLLIRAAGDGTTEVDLDPLGDAARAAAAALLGTSVIGADEALNVVVAVDRSASFRPRLADGALEAVLAVLSGIAATLVRDLRVGAAVLGEDVTWARVTSPADFANVLAPAVLASRPASAFRSGDPALATFDPDRNTQVYLVTDAVPGDLAALEAAEQEDGQGRHLVVLAEASAYRAGRTTTLPVTLVEPRPDLGAHLSDPSALAPLVRSLLHGCFAPGSPSAARVAR